MADIWDDDFDADTDESDLVKQLRKVIRDGKKENERLAGEVSTLKPAVRKVQLADSLKALGITNPKIVGLVPKDIDATEESVKAWVEEYGDVFSIKTSEPAQQEPGEQSTGQGASSVEPDVAAQWGRIQSQDSQAGATTPDQESNQLAMLQAAAKAANGNSDKYLQYLRGEVPIPTQ